ncbi:MAG: DUF6515 family protein [Candidatus Cloacimonetes bacterium]|nr:DUF6515 family protein [Candidatus Cloacimonadota bacterium]
MTTRARIAIVVILVFLAGSAVLLAGPKVVTSGKKSPRVIQKETLPKGSVEIEVGGERYYQNHGIFYKKHPHGYKVVKAPKGARIRRIPDGFRMVRRHDRVFYVFYHTWYYYDEPNDVYIVVDEPEDEYKDNSSDKIYLVNGSVLVGMFLGGTDEIVKFLFDDEVRKIPVEEIVSIEFAAAME